MYVATHYEYATLKPLPVGGLILRDIPPLAEPAPVAPGRVVPLISATGDDDDEAPPISKLELKRQETIARYLGALSHKQWRTTKEIAETLGISATAVKTALDKADLRALVYRSARAKGTTHFFVWRLKPSTKVKEL